MTTDPPTRAFLSSPDERELLLGAFDSNWIAQPGLHVDVVEIFEIEVEVYVGAEPASVDARREDWSLDAELVAEDPRSPRATVAALARF